MDLEELLQEILERLELPELEMLCEYRWVLELVIKLCDLKERRHDA